MSYIDTKTFSEFSDLYFGVAAMLLLRSSFLFNAAQDFNLASFRAVWKIMSIISLSHPNPFNLNKKGHQI